MVAGWRHRVEEERMEAGRTRFETPMGSFRGYEGVTVRSA